MYIIVVYDVEVERLNQVRNFLKLYLNWVQNSVLEGEVTKSQMREIKSGIKEIIDENKDCVMIYSVRLKKYMKKEIVGIEKGETGVII